MRKQTPFWLAFLDLILKVLFSFLCSCWPSPMDITLELFYLVPLFIIRRQLDATFDPWQVTKETSKDLVTSPILKMNQTWGDLSCLVSPIRSCLEVVWTQLNDVNHQYVGRSGLGAGFSSQIRFLSSVVCSWAVFHHTRFILMSVTRGLLGDWVRIFHYRLCSLFVLPGCLSSSYSIVHGTTCFRNEFFQKESRGPWPAWAGRDFKGFLFVPSLSLSLWFSLLNLLLGGHRRYQGSWAHWVILGPIPSQARSSPSLPELPLGHF